MRLEFEPTTTVEKEISDEVAVPSSQEFQTLLKKGILAAKNGERDEARDLLMQATEIDSLNEDAWMWLASISDYPEELVAFLTNVLTINPENVRAKKWLARTESLLAETVNNNGDDSVSIETPAAAASDTVGDRHIANAVSCPFCEVDNDASAVHCGSCRASLSLSDVEALLSRSQPDCARIYEAVNKMEAEWECGELDDAKLMALGIGHFNLRNHEKGQEYLRELLSRDPNNVILSGQLNTIAIRLDEMQHQDEIDRTKPKGKSILVVDDSATVRKLISSKLEKSGHNVACAVDGVDGLDQINATMPDIVFLDIAMPRMDGYEVCKQIRANPGTKDLPVVMISGKDGFFDKVRGKMAGASGYVTKPFGPDTLMKALEDHLAAKNCVVE